MRCVSCVSALPAPRLNQQRGRAVSPHARIVSGAAGIGCAPLPVACLMVASLLPSSMSVAWVACLAPLVCEMVTGTVSGDCFVTGRGVSVGCECYMRVLCDCGVSGWTVGFVS